MDLCELEASLVYKVSSMTDRAAIQKKSALKEEKNKGKNIFPRVIFYIVLDCLGYKWLRLIDMSQDMSQEQTYK